MVLSKAFEEFLKILGKKCVKMYLKPQQIAPTLI